MTLAFASIAGSDTFVITRTEVLLALNAAPDHRLALVAVHPDGPHFDEVRYVGDVLKGAEPSRINDFGRVSQMLSWSHDWDMGRAPFRVSSENLVWPSTPWHTPPHG